MWLVLGTVSTLLPFLPAKWSERFFSLNYLPKWHWYVWVIGFLFIAVIAVFEGGHRQVKLLNAKIEESQALPNAVDPWIALLRERQKLEAELQPLLEVEECGIKIIPQMKIGKDEADYRKEQIERLRRDIEDIGRQLIRQRDAQHISPATLSMVSEWQALASRFEKLPADVRADWNRGSDGIESWSIRAHGHEECESLCKLAGAMLLRSPRVSAELDETLRSEEAEVARWLYFLKKAKGLSDYQYGLEQIAENEQKPIYFGSIHGLASLSYRMCIECSAKEI